MARTTASSYVPVAVAALLIAVSITGARLYASSTASAAVAEQRAETCSALVALQVPPTQHPELVHVDTPRHTAIARPRLLRPDGNPGRRITVISIEGDLDDLGLQPLGPGEVAVSTNNLFELGKQVGDTIELEHGRPLTITQTYADVPFDPVPEFWCGQSDLFQPTPTGDRPAPHLVASADTVVAVNDRLYVYDEYRLVPEALTLAEANEAERAFAAVADAPRNELGRVLARARAVHTTVERNLAPVLLIALVADTVVLVAAGVLVARERRRELRLLAVRGVHPARVMVHTLPPLLAAVLAGTVVGVALAWVGVTLFAPSSLLEPAVVRNALALTAAAALVATVVVASVVAAVGNASVDRRRSRQGARVPAALVVAGLVVLAVVSLRALDQRGGVRTSGVESRGGDLIAMGFPLFALLAAVALAGGVIAVVTPRLRLTGRRLRRSVRLGWRRVVLEAPPLAAVVVSVALAAGCFTIAVALTAGAERQLADKAAVYVGTDLAVTVYDPVEGVPDSTVVATARAHEGDDPVDLWGVDPDEFAQVATLRADGADRSLTDMMALLEPGTTIAVGSHAQVGDTVTIDDLTLQVVATARFFPGSSADTPQYVMLRDEVPFATDVLLVRDPAPDLLTQLRDQGVRTGLVIRATTTFDGSAYSALRWAYIPLGVLGVLFAAVALALQLLVISARREQRRVAHALMVRTGFRRVHTWWAAVVETGVPLATGAVLGVAAAVMAAAPAVPRLDPMPLLEPPAEFVMPWLAIAAVAVAVPVWTVVIAAAIVRSTERGDPMRVFQGAP